MFTADKIGSARVYVKDDPDCFLLHPDCYEALKSAWMKGEAFFVGKDVYGDESVVKLGAVIFISRGTPETARLAREEAREVKRAEAFDSGN